MVEAIYNRKFLRLLDQATPVEAARLQSLRTPHATAWVTSPHPSTLTPPEFRSGLRWILGLPVQTRTSNCAVCGREADTTGVHYVTCQKSGERSRGHTRLRNVVANALRAVAWNVETEKPLPPQVPLPTSTERLVPADVFIPGWDPLPLAIDFTIVTPLRRSDASRLTSSARRCFSELMDQAAADKIRRYGALCAKAGWGFQPFIADTFGAMWADARHFIQRLIQRKKERIDDID